MRGTTCLRRPRRTTAAGHLRVLFDGRFWRHHPAPFAKTARGFNRRAERSFITRMKNRA